MSHTLSCLSIYCEAIFQQKEQQGRMQHMNNNLGNFPERNHSEVRSEKVR